MEQVEGDGTSRIAWFMTGAIIGATVALLYAQGGKETRKYINDKTQQGAKDAVRRTSPGQP